MSRRVLLVIVVVLAAFTARSWIDWRPPAVSATTPTAAAASPMTGRTESVVATAHDPVCLITVNETQAKADRRVATYRGQTYYFCSHQCRRDFEADPARFVPSVLAAAPPAARTP